MARTLRRRDFLKATAGGYALSLAGSGIAAAASARPSAPATGSGPGSKVRVGKAYLVRRGAGWPNPKWDHDADVRRIDARFARLQRRLPDVEFVDGGLVSDAGQVEALKTTFRDVDGIILIHLSLGTGRLLKDILALEIPTIFLTLPYSGHEWTTIAPLAEQGKRVELLATSDLGDVIAAVRPFRAIHHLKRARILYMRNGGPNAEYAQGLRDRFGVEIETIHLPELAEAYESVDDKLAEADAERWIRQARKVVEPTREDIVNSSRMYFAMKKLLEEHSAHLITINCLGLGLMRRGLAYPCLGFSRLNGEGLGGICERDLPSSMTHLIFLYLTGKPGFVTDPVIDTSNDTIIHAHCVSAIKMAGPEGKQCPYIIRNHLEDLRGASLQVKMRVGQKITMAKLVGTDTMLISTGKITGNPDVDRGCRTKVATKVANARKIAENWHYGLHRVMFYGDHVHEIVRLSRFLGFKVLHEGVDEITPPETQIERDTNVYAS
ncbi:MAG: hypothetical protein PVH68_15900 [Armatimonadota bacterium]|jgi:hypothetical protein